MLPILTIDGGRLRRHLRKCLRERDDSAHDRLGVFMSDRSVYEPSIQFLKERCGFVREPEGLERRHTLLNGAS